MLTKSILNVLCMLVGDEEKIKNEDIHWYRYIVGKLQLTSHMHLFGPLEVALPQNTMAWASLF